MTLNEIYKEGKSILLRAGNESPSFDCMCILNHCFNIDRHYLIINGNEVADEKIKESFFDLIQKRSQGYPLQYAIGEWEFMDLKFKVGKGVLIPREDTEVLVNSCLKEISSLKNPLIIDLCAGTGAIGISVAKKRKDSKVICFEYSSEAFSFLVRNVKLNDVENVVCIKGDIFEDFKKFEDCEFDAILSNPPYIKTNDIDSLQTELSYEPRVALDGGEDGLNFYKIIANKWVQKLKKDGKIFLELGINQDSDVANLLESAGLFDTKFRLDMNGVKRVVIARK